MFKPANDRSDYLSLHMQPVIPIFSINEAFVLYTLFMWVLGFGFFFLHSVLWVIPFLSVKFYIWEQIVLYLCEYCLLIQAHTRFKLHPAL